MVLAHHFLSAIKGNGETENWECEILVAMGSPPSGAVGSSTRLLRTSPIQNLTNLFPLGSTSVTANFPSFSFHQFS